MAYTKRIRPGYKKRVKTGVKTGVKTPIRRPGWVPGGSVVCWRMGWAAACLSGCRRGKEGGPAAGVGGSGGGGQGAGLMACRWWPSVRRLLVCRGWLGGGDPAVFNQPLTTFLVVAMVWRLTVFFLCSYRQFRRCWRLFRSPGAGRCWAVSVGGLGLLAV